LPKRKLALALSEFKGAKKLMLPKPQLESCVMVVNALVSCSKCGAELAENAKFCHVCGSAVRKVRREEFSVSSENLIEKIKELIRQGNITKIVIKDEKGKTLFEMPATVGVVGAILVPWLAALGAIAALATRCTIVVEREE